VKKKYDPPKILTDEVAASTLMAGGIDPTYPTGAVIHLKSPGDVRHKTAPRGQARQNSSWLHRS